MKDCYANIGRPSIDPVVSFRLQLVMYLEGLRSERQLMRLAADRLSVRWYILPSWFRKRYQVSYGSWLDWVPKPAESRRVDVWRIVVRNITVPYRDCGHVIAHPGKREQCRTYHNVAILVIDPSSKGAVFDYF